MGDNYDSANEDKISETVREEEESDEYDSEYTISERSEESDRLALERSETFGPNEIEIGAFTAMAGGKPANQSSTISLSKR